MRGRRGRMLAGGVVILAAVAIVASLVVPPWLDRSLNVALHRPPYAASERARRLHGRLAVADLHGDSLFWGRDLLQRSERGQVDLPRLLEAGVALQAFAVFAKIPSGQNYESNQDHFDMVTPVALLQRWPPRTWWSRLERARYQAGRLREMAGRSGGRLRVVETRADLAAVLAAHASGPGVTGGLLSIEGAYGDMADPEALFAAGFRLVAPVHFLDNALGGSAHGAAKGGLTAAGRAFVKGLEARRILVDVAHASPATIADVLAVAQRPVVASHTGVKGTCDRTRNLGDGELRGIAATGGLIGIGYWDEAVCGREVADIARAIRYTADRVGVDHVALGSDFDGAVAEPFDVTGLVQLTEALLAAGFDDDQVAAIMGGNVFRLLGQALP